MATTTGTINFYWDFILWFGESRFDLDADTFIWGLSTTTYVPNQDTHNDITDITNEVSGNGYARQTSASGVTTWTRASGVATFDITTDPVFTASGGSIVARFFWIFNDTQTAPVADGLVLYGLLDDTPADVTTTDGNTLTIQINASGLFTLS